MTMPGQLIKRGERKWLVRIYMGVDPQTGKRQYFSRMVHGHKRDAERYLSASLRDRDLGTFAEPSKVTMGELFDDLLRDYEVNGKRLDWASIVVEKHLRGFFGKIRAAKLTSDLLNRYVQYRRVKELPTALSIGSSRYCAVRSTSDARRRRQRRSTYSGSRSWTKHHLEPDSSSMKSSSPCARSYPTTYDPS